MTARLIFICHASTDAVRRSAFPADEPLDGIGKREAAALAGSVPSADQIWSSPELRARETAQALGLKAAVEPALRDCDYGKWSGQSFDDVSAREPDAVATWLRDPAAAPHGGESLLELSAARGVLARRAVKSTPAVDCSHTRGHHPRRHCSRDRGNAAIVLANRYSAAVMYAAERQRGPLESCSHRMCDERRQNNLNPVRRTQYAVDSYFRSTLILKHKC